MTRLAILLAAFIVQAAQPPRDPRGAVPATTASIAGRVADDRGHPVPGAMVVAAGGPAFPGARSAITTEDGRYALRDLTPGFYTVSVAKAGFPTARSGQTRPAGPGKSFELKAGQQMTMPLTLPRGAVITGTAVDENGNPSPGFIAIARESDGAVVPLREGGTAADAHGRFRVYGLAAGTYRILNSTFGVSTDPNDADGSGPITVSPGEERDGIVVRHRGPRPTTYVTVSVSPGDSQTLRGLQLSLHAIDRTRFGYSYSAPNPDGTRTLAEVAEGRYRIVAHGGTSWGAADVAVDGEHPVTVAIAMSPGVKLTGTAVYDGTPPSRPRSTSVSLSPADTDGLLDNSNYIGGVVNPDGTFTLNGVPPGRCVIKAASADGWTIASVTLGDTDITDVPLTVAQENVSGLTVRLTKTSTVLRGVASAADGGPAGGMDVVAFPMDEKYRVMNSRRVATSRTDAAGEFEIRGLPPGVYGLAVVEESQPETLRDPASVSRLRALASAAIGAGETRTVNLTVR